MAYTYEWPQAVNIIQQRRAHNSGLLNQMIAVRQRYNGEFVIPVPASSDDNPSPMMMANLVDEAIDQPAMRAASVMPSFFFPQLEDTLPSKERARTRRRAVSATLTKSQFHLGLRKAFRHIGGYGSASLLLVPNDDLQIPRIELRDPLTSYPEPKATIDFSPPRNIGYVTQRSTKWLMDHYGPVIVNYWGDISQSQMNSVTELWDCLEWVDSEHFMLGVMGPSNARAVEAYNWPMYGVMLDDWVNKAGVVPAVCPTAITLDRLLPRVQHMLGKMDFAAELAGLAMKATKRTVSGGDRFILGAPNETPVLVDGSWHTADTGMANLVQGAREVGVLHNPTEPMAWQQLQWLSSQTRMDAGVPQLMGGQPDNYAARTGQGMNTLMGISVDPRVAEMQEVMAESLRQLVHPMLEMYRAYWPDGPLIDGERKPFVMFSGWQSDRGVVKFTPKTDFEDGGDECACIYPIAGSDLAGTTVSLAQLEGAHGISLATMRELHPLIADAEEEGRLVLEEALDNAMLETLHQQSSAGLITPIDMAVIRSQIRKGEPLDSAIQIAHEAAQKRQATEAPPAQPGQTAAPESMPGLGPPGQGAEQPAPAGPQPTPSLQDMIAALGRNPPTPQGAPAQPLPVH